MEHEDRNPYIRECILKEIDDIHSFLDGMTEDEFCANTMCQKAVVMSLVNIGELCKSLTASYTDRIPGIPWRDIRGFRNIAAHNYGGLDMDEVWKIAVLEITTLEHELITHPV